jgi:hypothetical protein
VFCVSRRLQTPTDLEAWLKQPSSPLIRVQSAQTLKKGAHLQTV